MDINIQLDSNQNLYYGLWLKPKQTKKGLSRTRDSTPEQKPIPRREKGKKPNQN